MCGLTAWWLRQMTLTIRPSGGGGAEAQVVASTRTVDVLRSPVGAPASSLVELVLSPGRGAASTPMPLPSPSGGVCYRLSNARTLGGLLCCAALIADAARFQSSGEVRGVLGPSLAFVIWGSFHVVVALTFLTSPWLVLAMWSSLVAVSDVLIVAFSTKWQTSVAVLFVHALLCPVSGHGVLIAYSTHSGAQCDSTLTLSLPRRVTLMVLSAVTVVATVVRVAVMAATNETPATSAARSTLAECVALLVVALVFSVTQVVLHIPGTSSPYSSRHGLEGLPQSPAHHHAQQPPTLTAPTPHPTTGGTAANTPAQQQHHLQAQAQRRNRDGSRVEDAMAFSQQSFAVVMDGSGINSNAGMDTSALPSPGNVSGGPLGAAERTPPSRSITDGASRVSDPGQNPLIPMRPDRVGRVMMTLDSAARSFADGSASFEVPSTTAAQLTRGLGGSAGTGSNSARKPAGGRPPPLHISDVPSPRTAGGHQQHPLFNPLAQQQHQGQMRTVSSNAIPGGRSSTTPTPTNGSRGGGVPHVHLAFTSQPDRGGGGNNLQNVNNNNNINNGDGLGGRSPSNVGGDLVDMVGISTLNSENPGGSLYLSSQRGSMADLRPQFRDRGGSNIPGGQQMPSTPDHYRSASHTSERNAMNDSIMRNMSSTSLDLTFKNKALQHLDKKGVSLAVKKKPTYRRGPIIGRGAFSTVYLMLNEGTGEMMAAKRVKFPASLGNEEVERRVGLLKREIQVMKDLDHPHIVRYLFTDHPPDGWDSEKGVSLPATPRVGTGASHYAIPSLIICMEYVSGGSVQDVIQNFGALPEVTAATFVAQMLLGLAYLTEQRIVHLDVKPANALLRNDGVVKISDFGTTVQFNCDDDATNSGKTGALRGTPQFMAPEVIRGEPVQQAADVWSLGCTVVALLTGNPPWHSFGNSMRILSVVAEGGPLLATTLENVLNSVTLSENAKAFVRLCLRNNPKDRPTCMELLGHPWIESHDLVGTKPQPLPPATMMGYQQFENSTTHIYCESPRAFGSMSSARGVLANTTYMMDQSGMMENHMSGSVMASSIAGFTAAALPHPGDVGVGGGGGAASTMHHLLSPTLPQVAMTAPPSAGQVPVDPLPAIIGAPPAVIPMLEPPAATREQVLSFVKEFSMRQTRHFRRNLAVPVEETILVSPTAGQAARGGAISMSRSLEPT